MTKIVLPYHLPPLSENDRMGWRQKAPIVAQLRRDTLILARAANLPTGCAHATVCLHYAPRDSRTRDAENLVPTLKACCDGLVDHGLVADDTPAWMTKLMPVIEPKSGVAHGILWLTVETESS